MIIMNDKRYKENKILVPISSGNRMRNINFYIQYNKTNETGVILTPKITFKGIKYDIYKNDIKCEWVLNQSCSKIIQLDEIPFFDDFSLDIEYKGVKLSNGNLIINTKR